jgi:hypothetical protein
MPPIDTNITPYIQIVISMVAGTKNPQKAKRKADFGLANL